MRDLEAGGGEYADGAVEQAEAGGAASSVLESKSSYKAEADAEQRHAGLVALGEELVEAALADPLHRPQEGADAGQDEALEAHAHGRLGADRRRVADVLERLG
ncbi:MAG: hypothetical protein U0R71_11330 [Solirubrobacterales bacterium]